LTASRTVAWVDTRNPFGEFLAPPLVVTSRADGSLALAPFPGWDAYRANDWRPPLSDAQSLFRGEPVEAGPVWALTSEHGMDALTAGAAADDFVVEGVLRLDGARGGLALRLDGSGNGLYVELAPPSRAVSLQRWGVAHGAFDGSQRHDFTELQRTELVHPVARDAPLPFRWLSAGPCVECALGGEVVIATMTGASGEGRWGLWVQDGSLIASDLRWSPMRRPQSGIAATTNDLQEKAGA
jgi:hypothetical protein